MDFFETSARLSSGYQSQCAVSSTTSCNTTMVTNVNPAINRTSHPFHTGFSAGGSAARTEGTPATAKGSGGLGTGTGDSALTVGCGSNCGLSDDDKVILSYESLTAYSVLATGNFFP